jgi:predicted mannosyl-3-phosphoglycerate phosphatase (HAD superfamily)
MNVSSSAAVVPVVVFSDVDRVIENPLPASMRRAARAVAAVAREGGSIVLCSNGTRAELEHFQQQLGICAPFIAEGGSAAFIPRGYFKSDIAYGREAGGYEAIEFALPYNDVVATLRDTAARLRVAVTGFNDMSVEEVARDSGLTLLRARLAKLREYVEPCRVENPDVRHRLVRALEAARLRCVRHGHYEYVGSVSSDEAARHVVRSLYWRACGSAIATCLPGAPADARAPRATDAAEWAEGALNVVRTLRARSEGATVPMPERRHGRPAAELTAWRTRLEREWEARQR